MLDCNVHLLQTGSHLEVLGGTTDMKQVGADPGLRAAHTNGFRGIGPHQQPVLKVTRPLGFGRLHIVACRQSQQFLLRSGKLLQLIYLPKLIRILL